MYLIRENVYIVLYHKKRVSMSACDSKLTSLNMSESTENNDQHQDVQRQDKTGGTNHTTLSKHNKLALSVLFTEPG